jgi:hypothetical protein
VRRFPPHFGSAELIATGTLTGGAAAALLNRPFPFGGLRFDNGPLFQLNSTFFQSIPFSSTGAQLAVRIVATTQQGEILTIPLDPLWRWTHFSPDTGPTRYGARDTIVCIGDIVVCNGDDWSYPGVVALMETATGADLFEIDDISNMNGGHFPPHVYHPDGLHIDARFFTKAAFMSRDQAVADRLVDILKANLSKIQEIWEEAHERQGFNGPGGTVGRWVSGRD